MDSSRQEYRSGCYFFLQRNFPTRDWSLVSCIAGRFLPDSEPREKHGKWGTLIAEELTKPQWNKKSLLYTHTQNSGSLESWYIWGVEPQGVWWGMGPRVVDSELQYPRVDFEAPMEVESFALHQVEPQQ